MEFPTLAKEFIADCWRTVADLIPHVNRMLLYGPPGSGKSTIGMQYAEANERPFYRVPLQEESDAIELRGHWIQTNNGFEWHDGAWTRASAPARSGPRIQRGPHYRRHS